MRSASSPRAVSKITGKSDDERIHRQSESPSSPGSITSSTTRPGASHSITVPGVVAVRRHERPVTVALEVPGDHVADDRFVVDYEDSRHLDQSSVDRRAEPLRVP